MINYDELLDLKLMITGPTYIRKEIREAATLPEFGHRDSEATKRFKPIFENLKEIAQVNDDYIVAIVNGSGSYAMETSIRSMVKDSDIVLNVSVGAFGDLYHKITKVNGKKAELLKFEPGKAIDLNILEAKLEELKPNVITFTHNETSTGVKNDVKAVCDLAHKYGAITLVDGVSIFGGAPSEIMEGKPYVYSTATQKALATPAGFGIMFIRKDALEIAEQVPNRGYTTDLIAHVNSAKKYQTLTTPNTALANQLLVETDYIVNEEGVENRFKRHKQMQQMVFEWITTLPAGFKKFAQDGYESPTVTTVQTPHYFTIDTLKQIKENMRQKGYLFDPGYGKLNKSLEEEGKNLVFRIGHMGDITPEMLNEYLGLLKEELEKFIE